MDFPPFILASESPRRRALLEEAGFDFTVEAPGVEETVPGSGDAGEIAVNNALEKARAVASRLESGIVVGADTVVSLDGKIIGKPADKADAVKILGTLSGTRHEVVTGVALIDAADGRSATFAETTQVVMRAMSEDEIREYVDSGEALGKAGAYAIQESGDRFIERIDGSFSNVVGFPVEAFTARLSDFAGKKGNG